MITEHEKWNEFLKKLEEAYNDGRVEWDNEAGWFILVPPEVSEDEYMRVKPFAMGHCSKCEKYIPPTWMIWDSEPCPFCGEPFHSLPRTKNGGVSTFEKPDKPKPETTRFKKIE